MPQTPQLEDICIEDLFSLRSDIDSFVNAYCASEEAYCEGEGDYAELRQLAESKASRLRGQVRGLAIAWGIHAEFLRQYDISRQSNFKSVA
jgi:hypothetical protein